MFIVSYSSQEVELSGLNGFWTRAQMEQQIGEKSRQNHIYKIWEEIVYQRKICVVIS